MYTEAELVRQGKTCTVRAVVTRPRTMQISVRHPIEVWNGVNWVPFPDDELALEEAEAHLIDAFYPEAEAAGDWRIP